MIKLDYIFPVAYALFFSSLIARINAYSIKEPGPTLFFILFLLPIAAGAVDYIENTLHVFLLRKVTGLADLNDLPRLPIILASLAASLKYILIFVSIVVLPFLKAINAWTETTSG